MPEIQDQNPPRSEWDLGAVAHQPEAPPASEATEQPAEAKPTSEPTDAPVSETAPLVQIADPIETENQPRNREIYEKLLAARNAPPAVRPLEPPIPHVLAQTKLEMAAGAAQSRKHAEQQALGRAQRKPTASDIAAQGTSTPVFRPPDGAGSKERTPAKLR